MKKKNAKLTQKQEDDIIRRVQLADRCSALMADNGPSATVLILNRSRILQRVARTKLCPNQYSVT